MPKQPKWDAETRAAHRAALQELPQAQRIAHRLNYPSKHIKAVMRDILEWKDVDPVLVELQKALAALKKAQDKLNALPEDYRPLKPGRPKKNP